MSTLKVGFRYHLKESRHACRPLTMTISSDPSIPELILLDDGEAVLLDAEDLVLLDAGEPIDS